MKFSYIWASFCKCGMNKMFVCVDCGNNVYLIYYKNYLQIILTNDRYEWTAIKTALGSIFLKVTISKFWNSHKIQWVLNSLQPACFPSGVEEIQDKMIGVSMKSRFILGSIRLNSLINCIGLFNLACRIYHYKWTKEHQWSLIISYSDISGWCLGCW